MPLMKLLLHDTGSRCLAPAAGDRAAMPQAVAATGFGEQPGTAITPFDLCPLPTLQLPTGDGSTACGHLGGVQGGDREGRGHILLPHPLGEASVAEYGVHGARTPCTAVRWGPTGAAKIVVRLWSHFCDISRGVPGWAGEHPWASPGGAQGLGVEWGVEGR